MTTRYFMLALSILPALLAAGLYLYAYSLAGPTGRLVLSGGLSRLLPDLRGDLAALWRRGRHAGKPDEHQGATERSPLLKTTAAFAPEPPILHIQGATEATLDDEALAILEQFDQQVAELRRAPGYVRRYQQHVDRWAQRAGMSLEEHRRWRQRAWEMSTGSYPVLDRELVNASPGA